MLKLVIGNKNYSSWSLRGWLAVRQSGLPFEEVVVPLYDEAWGERRECADIAPAAGKVPILWDGDIAVWDSLAIVEYLNDKTGNTKFWPENDAARGFARSIAAEMHAGFAALRNKHGMNLRKVYPAKQPDDDVQTELARLMHIWGRARDRFGEAGPFLFGEFGAADILFAPVCTRISTYQLPVAPFASSYVEAMLGHPFLRDWTAAAHQEDWVIDKFEQPADA